MTDEPLLRLLIDDDGLYTAAEVETLTREPVAEPVGYDWAPEVRA